MRKTFFTHLFIWCVVLGFASTGLAQDQAPSIGKAPGQQDQPIKGIGVHPEGTDLGYGSDGIAATWCSIGVPSGTLTLLGASTGLHQGGDFDGTGTFYATLSPATLITVDLATGVETTVAAITGVVAGQTLTGMAWNDANGTMYLGSTDVVATSWLYTLDLGTGVATPIGSAIGQTGLIAIACDCAGNMYSVDILSDDLWSIDTGTGVGTLIGPLGFDLNFAQDADFNPNDGVMYLSAFNNTSFTGQLRSVDLGTGLSTLEFDWGFIEITDFSIDAACGGGGPLCIFMDDFEDQLLTNWTITNNGGTCDWMPIELATRPYTMPPSASGWGMTADADLCGSGTTTLTTSTMSAGVNATDWAAVWIEWDNDWRIIDSLDIAYVEMSIDGGATWTIVVSWDGVDQRDTHEVWDVSGTAGAQSDVRFRFRTSMPGWDWWWAIDNFAIYFDGFIPVELTSFAASVNDGEVTLSWSTSTETNNQGFDVERNSGNGFEKIGFVAGFGTSTENHSYSFVDGSLREGSYAYRLKQIDYDGTFEYSDVIEVDVTVPKVFALEQNYPNPFNPSTTIKFSLAADSKVTLTVFDILGQEVVNLISGNLAAGLHEINFNASNIPSGVYFYRIDATVVDGTNFTSVKKMILTK